MPILYIFNAGAFLHQLVHNAGRTEEFKVFIPQPGLSFLSQTIFKSFTNVKYISVSEISKCVYVDECVSFIFINIYYVGDIIYMHICMYIFYILLQ